MEHANIAGYTFERISEFEIRIKAPDGDVWRIRYSNDRDGFAKFLWDFAVAASSITQD